MFLAAAAPAIAAQGKAEVRFIHAVPMVGTASLEVNGTSVGKAGFGEQTDLASVPAGPAKIVLRGPDGLRIQGSDSLEAGKSYTLVAMAQGKGAEIRSFRDGPAKRGVSRLRLIHSAPELGEPNLLLNGKTLMKRMSYTRATTYWTLKPGDYRLAVENPKSGQRLLSQKVSLAAGSSQTALVVGSGGERNRVVLAQDDVAAPSNAPATGFGGLAGGVDGGSNWLAAILAALAAAAVGLVAHARIARGRDAPSG